MGVTGFIGDKGAYRSGLTLDVWDQAAGRDSTAGGSMMNYTGMRNAPNQSMAQAVAQYNAARAQENQARASAGQMTDYLTARANGAGGPSPMEQSYMANQAAAQRQNLAMALGNRANPYAAQRQAALANEGMGLQGSQRLIALRLQDQQQAQAELAQQLQANRQAEAARANMYGNMQMGYLGAAQNQDVNMAQIMEQRNKAMMQASENRRGRGMDLTTAKLEAYNNQIARDKAQNAAFTQSMIGATMAVGGLVTGGLAGAAGAAAGKAAAGAATGAAQGSQRKP